ncbi:MAG: hypothetical protein NUV78_03505 [Candidatus Zambryskibacteria bacterium]|nr:hypothetical protein [Candidatus Zambryskibacteria bacterium]
MYLYRLAVNCSLGSLWLTCLIALVVVFWTDDFRYLGVGSEAGLVAIRLVLIISTCFSGWYYFGSFKGLRVAPEKEPNKAVSI